MHEQLDLEYKPDVSPSKGAELADDLVWYLERQACWFRVSGMALWGFSPRQCRLARQHSEGRIIFGPKGYKATRHATQDEITRTARDLESRAKVMLAESSALWKRFHAVKKDSPTI